MPKTDTVKMPKGKYYLGDPGYFISRDRWMEWLEAARHNDDKVLTADLDGRTVMGFVTPTGDGVYEDDEGYSYWVDSGLIGLVPVEVANPNADVSLGRLLGFDQEFECVRGHRIFKFGEIEIGV